MFNLFYLTDGAGLKLVLRLVLVTFKDLLSQEWYCHALETLVASVGGARMPYESLQALPASSRTHLPLRAQEIYWEAFNAAWEQCADSLGRQCPAAIEEAVSRSAWAAVRRKYRQDPVTRQWRLLA